jgi:hypothetical protein
MYTLNRKRKGQVAQGDITITAVTKAPKGEIIAPTSGQVVVAHSETGHHHSINSTVARLERGEDPWTCYLHVEGEYADLVHHRDVNPHETIRLPKGAYRIRRQREWTPEGWRAVQD